jgi:hypothetical protein
VQQLELLRFRDQGEKSEIFFVHCNGHCLNLVLFISIRKDNQVSCKFFGCIQMVYILTEPPWEAVFEKSVSR